MNAAHQLNRSTSLALQLLERMITAI